MYGLKTESSFDSAHFLADYHGKCESLHGHTYRFQVTLKGEPDHESMVMDFVRLKELVERLVVDRLDHSLLNDTIPQPTAENIALWIWRQIEEGVRGDNCGLYSVQVWETATSSILIHGEDLR